MILDYNYNSYSRKLDLSYITDKGSKQILSFNVNRFKSYYSTPNGKFTNWDGSKCDIKWVERPSKFEIRTFLTELDDKYKELLNGRTYPKMYTFDIEVLKDSTGEYADAAVATGEISTISICSPDLNTIVLGTLQMSDEERKTLDENFAEYLKNTEFFQSLHVSKQPYVKYVQFANEEEMLKYFLSNIVSKVPIMAGWNNIKYDWQYIVNRIRRCYPNLSVKMASCNRRVNNQTYKDKYGNNITLPMPEHTLIIDMMDVIETHDKKVLPMKESMKLDYIASESMGIHKIEYTKSLDDLYESDYGRYVFYNSVDSLLVQLINYRFKTLDSIYLIARYCNEKIANCFGKIAITEALVFNDFYEHDLKIVYEEQNAIRGKLVGAYVKKPVFGIHNWVCCNDFASLYPSTIRTCNLSFENYVGAFWDEKKLAQYKSQPRMYAVIGPNVFENEEKDDVKVKTGQLLYTFIDEEAIKPYRNNPDYFVTVNGCVYKNDKDYSFKRIQSSLQLARNKDKYLKQDIEAYVVSDIKHILEKRKPKERKYSEKIINHLSSVGLDIKCTSDLYNFDDLEGLKKKVSDEVTYLDSSQLAMKDIMNSMYGGSSHINFYWYNMNLANDITGEARNLIHIMEHHIPDWFRENWADAKELHETLGITVDKEHALKVLDECREITETEDINAYHKKSYVMAVYGDTDSCDYKSIIRITSNNGLSKNDIQIGKWFEENENNNKITLQNGTELVKTNDKVLNWSKEKGLHYDNVNYIMRHKVTKPKWKIKTKDGKEIIVTNDHSMIVFRDGKQLEVKPYEILKTDNILVCDNYNYEFVDIESCECIGSFEDEYVYDIEVADDTHTFIANNILVHNSLYLSYDKLLKTIEGIDNLSIEQKRDIIVNLNLKFLDKHNQEFIADYYAKRYGQSVHNFELETLNKSGVWQNVKKHYAQVLLWKDKEYFDIDKMKMKVVGLEMNKPSQPKMARKILNAVIRYMLENGDDKYLIHKLNMDVMNWKKKWDDAPIDDICANISVNGYTKYILDDHGEVLKYGLHCPSNVKALGNYNRIRNYYHLPGDEYYSGKMKLYEYGDTGKTDYFAYPAMEYPAWGYKYAPINRSVMFQKYVLDPLNRILEPAGLPKVNLDGSIQISLF